MNEILEILEFVGSAVWHVWPMFLISIMLSVLVRALKLDGIIRRAFSANIGKAIVLATLVGAFSPFCSCTVVPVIAGLLLSGVPLAPIMSFWIASPTMDPEIFTLSVGILGWPLALARLGGTLAISLAAGYVTLGLTRALSQRDILKAKKDQRETTLSPAKYASPAPSMAGAYYGAPATQSITTGALAAQPCGTELTVSGDFVTSGAGSCATAMIPSKQENQILASFRQMDWQDFGRQIGRESWSLGRWLLLAFVMEAMIARYVPQASIARLLGEDNVLAVPLATLIGIPLYLNNISALPIVSGLLSQGMQPGAAIAFLIAGPVTTIPAMTAVYGIVERRIFALYLGIGFVGAMLIGIVVNVLIV
jgi:uncharacterized membrane protein YraQ (UPF0718 family)